MSKTKERLDVLLVKKGLFDSREKARASIMAGQIFVDGLRIDKCGENINETSNIEFKGEIMPFVSRGGFKLDKAVKKFKINLLEKICLDIGASTGGFTDCMLQNGAKKVYAIDVGYGQFAWKLRVDPRVVCMERTNIRYVTPENINEAADFASIDVSFISLKKVIPAAVNLLKDDGCIMSLIKPQFEAGRDKVGKRGVVKEKTTHEEVIFGIYDFVESIGLNVLDIDYSPIKGPEGNIEYLIYFTKNQKNDIIYDRQNIETVVEDAHRLLNGEENEKNRN